MKNWIITLLCWSLPLLLAAQNTVRFTATSDAKQVVLGGYCEVSFTLENATGSNFTAPRVDGFKVLSGPSQSMSTSIINGRRSSSMSYSYTLQPKQIGKFPIAPARIEVRGETLKTEIIYVEVVKGKNQSASSQEELEAQLEEQIFIRAVPSTTQAHIGEQVLLDYKVYTTRAIESYNLVFESEYLGFFPQDIRLFDSRVIKEVIDGVQYSTKTLKRVALFPQQAGRLTIEPLVMELSIATEENPRRRRRSFFYTPLVTRFNVSTDSVLIAVQPLPDAAPPTFSGAIGQYQMTSSINRTKLTTDDDIAIRMTISGNGDLKQVQAPALMVSDSFELYDPKVLDEKNFESGGALTGSKLIEYLLLPRYPGQYQIQPTFSYFDPDSARYVTLSSRVIDIEVAQGRKVRRNLRPVVSESKASGELRDIHSAADLRQGGTYFTGSVTFWTLLGVPFLLLGGLVVVKRVQASRGPIDPELVRRRRAQRVAQQKLAGAKAFLDRGESRPFYDEISKGLLGYVGDKLTLPLSQMGQDNIRQRLEVLAVSEAARDRFMGVLKTCEMALFAGKDNAAAMQESYETALAVVVEVEQELGGKK